MNTHDFVFYFVLSINLNKSRQSYVSSKLVPKEVTSNSGYNCMPVLCCPLSLRSVVAVPDSVFVLSWWD